MTFYDYLKAGTPTCHLMIICEGSGSVVECLSQDRRAAGSSLTSLTALWSLSKTHYSLLSTGSTQEDSSPHKGFLSKAMLYMLFVHVQAFKFIVGPGHCPMISKYGPSLSKAVDPSFFRCENISL